MLAPLTIAAATILVLLSVVIAYTDALYRRIPNKVVLAALIFGLTINIIFGGLQGLTYSLGGFALAFGVMFLFHIMGAMGAGDVKLFAAVGSIVGLKFVLPALFIITITGGVMAVCKMVYVRT